MKTTRILSLAAVAAIGLIANLALYQSVEYSFTSLHIVDQETFNAPPNDAEALKPISGLTAFRYRPAHRMSTETFDEFFSAIETSDALSNAIAVSRRVRNMYTHAKSDSLDPFIPDQTIAEAMGRPVVCDTYARTAVAALDALGHAGRVVYLDGHVSMEVFDDVNGRWMYVDPNLGVWISDADNEPMGLVDFQNALSSGTTFHLHALDESTDDPQMVSYALPEPHPLLRSIQHPGLRSIYTNGFTSYEDGHAFNYRRKSIAYALAPANIVMLEGAATSRTDVRFGGLWVVLGMNAVLLALALSFLTVVFRRTSLPSSSA